MRGVRFDRALAQLVPDRTRSQLQKLVRRGRVKVNGRRVVRSNFDLSGGEEVLLFLEQVDAPTDGPAGAELDVVHVDDDLVVVDKAPGMLVHPTEVLTGGTVSELAVARFGRLPSIPDQNRPGIVHRLDRETSGLLVLARTPDALDALQDQFRSRTVEKHYLALVHGNPREDAFEVDRPLGPVPGHRDLQRIAADGRAAFTRFEVVERLRGFALVACHPTTGRRHQLRVHLASVGHPIAGDKLYRPEQDRVPASRLPHHALHAGELGFRHPRSGAPLRFEAPLPGTFLAFRQTLGD